MSPELRSANNPYELKVLLSELRRLISLGDPSNAKVQIEKYLASGPSKVYQPLDHLDLMELHAVTASVYDELEEYDAARDFLFLWAPKVQFQVVELRNKVASKAVPHREMK